MAVDLSVAPTLEDLQRAHAALERAEPRDLFYRAALEVVDLALAGRTALTVAEGLAILLQTWNASFYRFRPFDSQHLHELDDLVNGRRQAIEAFRPRTVCSLQEADTPAVERLFNDFERLLGPDGAAKCLHLLAPRFFPMWDYTIARHYGLPLGMTSPNGNRYLAFMRLMAGLCERLGGEERLGGNPLKAIDEYHYCRCKRWL